MVMINYKGYFARIALILILNLLFVYSSSSQNMIQYNKDFVLTEGVYLSFEEFKQQKPSIVDFKVVRSSQYSSDVSLEAQCVDTLTGKTGVCKIFNVFGFVQNNTLYIELGVKGMFYRVQILGSLIHYFDLQSRIVTSYDPRYDNPYSYTPYVTQRRTDRIEYVIMFETGEKMVFNYRNFSRFLAEKDPELYNELQNTKQKRKMIYYFMLKYNQKHQIYFPEN